MTSKDAEFDDPLLSTAELAQRTGISRRTWEGRRRKGGEATPAYLKLGRGASARVRYRSSAVEEWLNGQVRRSTTD